MDLYEVGQFHWNDYGFELKYVIHKNRCGKIVRAQKTYFYIDGSRKQEITPLICIEVHDAFNASFFNLKTIKEERWIPALGKMAGESLTRII